MLSEAKVNLLLNKIKKLIKMKYKNNNCKKYFKVKLNKSL